MSRLKQITRAAGPASEGEPGTWVSDAAREKFMAAYDRVWFPHVAALAEDGPVYGIDMPGDANPSVARAMITPPASCASWLDELLGKLSDRQAHLVGFSSGGWVALNQALRAPGRVASITLLDSAGLTTPDARFYRWLTISGLATLTPMPLRRRLARWLDLPHMLEPELMTLIWAAIRGYRAEPRKPDVLTDDELRAIDVPVLLVTGARSALLTPAQARTRGSLMPHAEVAVVPGSHGGFNRIDELNGRIAAFIKAQATGKQAAQPAQPPVSEMAGHGTAAPVGEPDGIRLDVVNALLRLGVVDRQIVVLHDLAGLTHAEVAAELGLPAGTVRWRYRVALARLRPLVAEVIR